jgi:hypothetical protein
VASPRENDVLQDSDMQDRSTMFAASK